MQERKTCLDVLEMLGIEYWTESSGWHKCCCLIHDDQEPSVRFSPDWTYWKCMVCSEGGDSLALLRFFTGCSFQEALDGVTIEQDFATKLRVLLNPTTKPDAEDELATAFILKHALRVGIPLEAIDQALLGDSPCRSLKSALRLAI